MDPYLERSAIWPDFHDRLITHTGEALQPLLRPRYAALTQDRLYVVEHDRPIRPDVAVVETWAAGGGSSTAVALEPDSPLVVELLREEIRQPVLHIIEPGAGNRIVTAIEVLSPDNKVAGPGRDSYLHKQDELWQAGTNLVEIDLLRAGKPTVRVSHERLEELPVRRYLVAVSRCWPTRCELYAFELKQRLPRVGIPLAGKDPDVVLDLQAAFSRCWQAGPYPELLRYDGRPPGQLAEDEVNWCAAILKQQAV
jgi:hypothetical protein